MNINARKRLGISGLMQVAMIAGIVLIFSGTLFTFAGDIFDVQTIAGSVSLQKIFVQQVDDETFVLINIKNTGNSDITELEAQLMQDTDSVTPGIQPFIISPSSSPLKPGMSGSAYEKIVDTDGDAISFVSGKEIAVIVNAITADGIKIIEHVTVRVR